MSDDNVYLKLAKLKSTAYNEGRLERELQVRKFLEEKAKEHFIKGRDAEAQAIRELVEHFAMTACGNSKTLDKLNREANGLYDEISGVLHETSGND